jgi:hypothetical protein
MKNILFILLLVAISSPVFATTFRVNNNPGVDAPYTTFEAAHDAALSWAVVGDTIIVEPSPISYGSFTIFKNVTVIGNGYIDPGSPIPQVNPNHSFFGSINISTNASPGIHLIGLAFATSVDIYGSNVVLTRCKILGDLTVDGDNNIIQSNYFDYTNVVNSGNNNIFGNNFFENGDLTVSVGASNTIIENNTFFEISTTYGVINFNNNQVYFRNNILHGWETANAYSYIISHNNLSNLDDQLAHIGSTTNGNYNMVTNLNLLAGGAPDVNTTISDLQPGPSANNSGYYSNGDDIGAFNDGTGRPTYIVNGIPPVPNIYSLELGGPNGNNLPVTLGTKTNN